MPRVDSAGKLEFHIYPNDHLPIHVHVKHDDGEAEYVIHEARVVST